MKYIYTIAASVLILYAAIQYRSLQQQLRQENVEPTEQTPFGRQEWRNKMRGGIAAPEAVLKARNEMRQRYQRAKVQRDGGLNEWESVGPLNVGGRVRALAVHPTNPNILYTGGVNGGVFKSTNAGNSWTALGDFLPSLAVTSIIINPNSPSVVYAATGEGITAGGAYTGSSAGAGIFRSTNAGATWDLVPALDPDNLEGFYWINKLAFNSEDPSVFYAVAQGTNAPNPEFGCAALYRFSDNGETYTELPLPCVSTAYTVYVNPNDSNHIMVGHSHGLFISTDGGISDWTTITSTMGFPTFPNRVEVAMSASDPDVIYALCQGSVTGTLTKSSNRGQSWSTVSSGLNIFTTSSGNNQGNYDNVIWVDPSDTNHLIIGGIDLWRSINGGTTLTQISDWTEHDAGLSAHADQHVIVEATDYDPSTNPKVYFGNDGGIATADNWKTVTQTTGWDILNDGLAITQFYASDIDGTNPNEIIAGSQDNGTWFSDDSGATWSKVMGGDGGFCGLNKQGQTPIYVSSQYGNFNIQVFGLNFFLPYFDLDDVETGSLPFIAEMEIYPNDSNKILVGGQNLWQVTFIGTADAKDVSPRPSNFEFISAIDISSDSSRIAVGYTDGDVYFSENGTSGPWQLLTLPETGIVSDIALHPTNKDRMMVVYSGYRDDNIWHTNDGGNTWEERSNGVPALHVNSITWHPDISGWVYIGTDMGVMASENSGRDWNITPSKGSHDGPAIVEVSQVEFTRNNTFGEHWLVATTYGRGIWKTKYVVKKDVYVDEDCLTCGLGIDGIPFETVEEAEERQASGQNWIIDGGNYPINGSVIINTRIDVTTESNETVIIGNN